MKISIQWVTLSGVVVMGTLFLADCNGKSPQTSPVKDTVLTSEVVSGDSLLQDTTLSTVKDLKPESGDQPGSQDSSSVTRPDPGSGRTNAPDFTLSDISGASHTFSSYQGKVVLVDFWATWCPPCRAEIPHLKKLHDAYKSQGLVILGVGLDKKTSISKFVLSNSVNYTVLVDESNITGGLFNVRGIPRTIIVDKKGRIAFDHTGFSPGMEKELETEIKTLLAEEY